MGRSPPSVVQRTSLRHVLVVTVCLLSWCGTTPRVSEFEREKEGEREGKRRTEEREVYDGETGVGPPTRVSMHTGRPSPRIDLPSVYPPVEQRRRTSPESDTHYMDGGGPIGSRSCLRSRRVPCRGRYSTATCSDARGWAGSVRHSTTSRTYPTWSRWRSSTSTCCRRSRTSRSSSNRCVHSAGRRTTYGVSTPNPPTVGPQTPVVRDP